MPSRSRESSDRCTARRTGSCYMTSPRTAGSCCPETPFASTWPVKPLGKSLSAISGWLVASFANGLSSDGQTLIFSDGLSGRTLEGNATVFRRRTDGSPAVSLGEGGGGGALSPDGRWVLAEAEGNLDSPAGGGRFDCDTAKGRSRAARMGAWLSDSKRIVFTGRPWRQEAQRLHPGESRPGMPRAITPDGVVLARKAAVLTTTPSSVTPVPGGALSDSRWRRRPAGASAQAEDIPVQWSPDGRYCIPVDNVPGLGSPAVDVFRVEVTTGARVLWKRLSPAGSRLESKA